MMLRDKIGASKGKKNETITLSSPRNFQQGVHIGYNDEGKFTGVPKAWAEGISFGGRSADGSDDTVVDYAAVQSSAIKPTFDDIDFVLRSPARGHKGLPPGTVRPTTQLPPAPRPLSPPPPAPSGGGYDAVKLVNSGAGIIGETTKTSLIPAEAESIYASEMSLEREKQKRLKNSVGMMDLDLSGMKMSNIPADAVERDRLHLTVINMNLSFNIIDDWPSRLEQFANLQRLNLDGNKLTFIPSQIKTLAKLRELTINGNELGALPSEIGCLRELERLELKNNKLVAIPDEIGHCDRLEELHLSGNPLEILPETIGYLKNLEVLDASCCKLEEIPETIGHAFKLMELNVGVNRLDMLPESIGCLTRLCALNVSDNQLVSLPYSLGNLYSVQKLYIDGNDDLDEEVIARSKQGNDQLMDCLEKRMQEHVDNIKTHLQGSKPALPGLPPIGGVAGIAAENKYHITSKGTKNEVDQTDTPHGMKRQDSMEAWEMQEKVNKLRILASGMRQNLHAIVREMKVELSKVTAVEHGIPLAQRVSKLKEEMAVIKPKVEPWSKGWKTPPMPSPGEDKLIILKRTTAAALDNISTAIDGLGTGIDNSTDMRLLFLFVKHLQNLNQLMTVVVAPSTPPPPRPTAKQN